MNILVLSDSHKNLTNLKRVLNEMSYDYVIFLGDYVSDIMPFAKRLKNKLFVVRGNADGDIDFDDDLLIEIKGKKFFISHGHNYGVKYGMNGIFQKATEMNADILLFGHTHIAFQTQLENGLIVLNPGSVGKGRLKENTFGMVKIEDDGLVTTKLYKVFS